MKTNTVTAILIDCGRVVKQYNMSRKNAVRVVKRGEGQWRDCRENIVVLYLRDENGNYVVPEIVYKNASPLVSRTVLCVEQCIFEQERKRLSGEKKIPRLPGIGVPRHAREQERATQMKKYECLRLILTNLVR
ncbi:hypothetical protein Psch_03207 [Pelotomaculum schinkii]|uniref:Uncharacterized protein n=1 Tax=Pelotomaculum schinkii TaxID=78350 RepID=A0A4Y7RBS5_9FIRM|nr:hypothetical protein [Pelotomaculum schinkii]TEB06163.1 hypothetical protein Psch_03207 [Pelotomaculum schinkii]